MKKTLAILMCSMLAMIFFSTRGSASVTSGNWYLQATTQLNTGGASQIPQIGGYLSQTGSIVSGVLHVSNSACFDWATDLVVTGTVNGSALTLTSDGANGEVVTINGTESSSQITGTYSIASGCADGDHGSISAVLLSPLTGNWNGTSATNGSASVATAALSQAAPNADGYSPLSGAVTLSGPQCSISGSLASDQSWIIGSLVQAVANMSDGSVLTLNGFVTDLSNAANQITLNFSISGGACSGVSGSVTYYRTRN